MSNTKQDDITSKELNILSEIRRLEKPTQRRIASSVGISLGMTNIMIKKLLEKGLIKVRKLNRRNVDYLLTNRGVKEVTKRSYRFLRRTMRNLKILKGGIRKIVEETIAENPGTLFVISGNGEVADITEMVLREISGSRDIRWRSGNGSPRIGEDNVVVLHCDPEGRECTEKNGHRISVTDLLIRDVFPGERSEESGIVKNQSL